MGVDITLTAAKYAHKVVAQVNAQMPRTYGDSFIHVSQIDHIVELSRPLCELKPVPSNDTFEEIGAQVASLIEDGSVLQCGIGAIPDAILPNLMDRKDLGIHTEMISDNVIPLIEAGVINGERKNFKPRKIILGFVLGSRRLFDFIDENPAFEFHPSAYTNDPFRIAMNDRMIAVNSAIEIDLTGQVCAESIGPHVLQRLRRATGLRPRRGPLQGRQADHRHALHSKGREDFAHRAPAVLWSRRSDRTRRRALCRHRIRHRLSAWQDDPAARRSAHRDRSSQVSRRACTTIASSSAGFSATTYELEMRG